MLHPEAGYQPSDEKGLGQACEAQDCEPPGEWSQGPERCQTPWKWPPSTMTMSMPTAPKVDWFQAIHAKTETSFGQVWVDDPVFAGSEDPMDLPCCGAASSPARSGAQHRHVRQSLSCLGYR